MSELKLYIEGKDMTPEVGIVQAVYDSYADDYIDTLVISLQDKSGIWSLWRPRTGEKIELQLDTLKTGLLYIHKVKATNGLYHITARSIPPYKNGVQKSEWEQVSFLQLAQTIASRLDLSLETYGGDNPCYKKIAQEDESNTAFLQRMCKQEGRSMLIFNGKLIIYDPTTLETKGATQSFEFTGKGDFNFFEREGERVGAVRVIDTQKKINGPLNMEKEEILFELNEKITIDETITSGVGKILTYSNLKPSDAIEARRWASGLLKSANRTLKTGYFKLSLQLGLMAGSVIHIKNDRASAWNGPVFLYRVKHNFKSEVSTLYFRAIGGD